MTNIGQVVAARNEIQFDADSVGRGVARKCWNELSGANTQIAMIISGEIRFSISVAAAIQASFDRAAKVVARARSAKEMHA